MITIVKNLSSSDSVSNFLIIHIIYMCVVSGIDEMCFLIFSLYKITMHSIFLKKTGTKSIAHYTPQNMLGYGSLLCWASNVIGKAKEPCVYKIVPVGKCSFTSLSIFDITCFTNGVKFTSFKGKLHYFGLKFV